MHKASASCAVFEKNHISISYTCFISITIFSQNQGGKCEW